jgi:hypothetical protein
MTGAYITHLSFFVIYETKYLQTDCENEFIFIKYKNTKHTKKCGNNHLW